MRGGALSIKQAVPPLFSGMRKSGVFRGGPGLRPEKKEAVFRRGAPIARKALKILWDSGNYGAQNLPGKQSKQALEGPAL